MSDVGGLSRRGLLTARGLGACTGGLLADAMPRLATAESSDQESWTHVCFARRAMACEFTVFLPPTVARAMVAAEAALDEIQELDQLLTVYSATSALSYVNQNAADGWVRTDNRLFQLLRRSAELTEETRGAFDVSAGALVRAWGFFQSPRRVPSDHERQAALACCGMKHVEFDTESRAVRYGMPGLEINLGSIGKGYAIDRAARRLREDFDIVCALVQGGLSSLYAMGSPGGDGRGWLVGIQNPLDTSRLVATVRLRDRALGTSGTAHQHFEAGGRRFGHLLDPRTGWPAQELASASVLAKDAATADALSTALFIMGLDKARDFCQNHPQIAALLVLQPGEQGRTATTGKMPVPQGTTGRMPVPQGSTGKMPVPHCSPQVVTFNLPERDINLKPVDGSVRVRHQEGARDIVDSMGG